MPDNFSNARAYFDPTFPSSGDSFSVSGFRNAFTGLGFLDHLPLQPRAHNPANLSIMVRGQDASQYYNPVYFGDANSRIPFSSGDTANFSAPVSNPRVDIVYMTPSGDLKVQTGTEAISPTLPSLAPSGDTRFPIAAIWCKPGMTKVVNFEDKESNSGDGYIYKDLRPWLRAANLGTSLVTGGSMASITGDNGVGTSTTAARSDHHHQGVHTARVTGSGDLFGDITLSPAGGTRLIQSGNEIQIYSRVVKIIAYETGEVATGSTALPNDDTIPQSNEGDQFMSLVFTPANASNTLKIEVVSHLSSTNGTNLCTALFQDSNANAIACGYSNPNAVGIETETTFTHVMKAGTNNPITFSVRCGAPVGTVTFNGVTSARLYGGSLASSIVITEFAD